VYTFAGVFAVSGENKEQATDKNARAGPYHRTELGLSDWKCRLLRLAFFMAVKRLCTQKKRRWFPGVKSDRLKV
jgi:hypothetical protein